ncbi:VQ motif-containing protein 18 [Beta vulgaris subsp. vulgaris]|uniref:VQ motif-containing protein 18 n=1 Tax=Beta vulgaris subsp. vulgaris TaxID=3555 RepID=UPI002037268A|nr:VQ motif-containing protein 18 [Beta vulgaris subsp. vulgaris]
MTHMLKKQSSMIRPTTTTTSGGLGMHRDSRVISKVQPKIRIIHIFAPEIIKTDVANFRELVQRLTGKPSLENDAKKGKGKGKKVKSPQDDNTVVEASLGCNKPTINTKLEVMMGSGSSSSPSSSSDHQPHEQDHHQQQGWRSTTGDHISSSGGYLTGFTDLDYSFDFNTMFHLGPADASSHLNSLGETTQVSFRG